MAKTARAFKQTGMLISVIERSTAVTIGGVMPRVVIYTTSYCPYCFGARALLGSKHVEFGEIDVTDDPARGAELERLAARRRVPQIFIGGHPNGGFDPAGVVEARGVFQRVLT